MRITYRAFLALCLLAFTLPARPAAAQGDMSEVEIATTPLGDGIFMLTGAGGNLGLCVGDDGVFIIDDQYAPLTGKILAAIAALSDRPVDFVFNTHYHGDHTGGNDNLARKGARLVGHTNVRRRLAADQYSKLLQRATAAAAPGALPMITFTDSLTFHLNGQEIIASHVPHAHTDGDGIVHFPGANVIHAGDTVFYGLYPYIDTSAGGSIDGMISATTLLIAQSDEKTRIIPGHGPLLNKGHLVEYLDMLTRARANVAAAMSGGADLTTVQAAAPCAEWDATLGQTWLTSDQFVQSVFDSLTESGN
jgi:glyoxylase-like metal-dependent hydrolase (beta-lactamase superfamily II)